MCCMLLFAQIQTGKVREQNSNRAPVRGVQVHFKDAVPTLSDDKGRFRLAFQGKKAGDLLFLQAIRKSGYELVNEKELEVLKFSPTKKLGSDIILAKAGTLDAARREYYAISNQALQAGFDKQKKALQQKLKNLQLTQQEYEKKFGRLSEEYAGQQKSLSALSDLFARINFDDVSAEYEQAFSLFKSGAIDEALRILERADLLTRMKNRLDEKKRLERAKREIARQKEKNEAEIRDDLQGMQLQAQLYVLTFQIEKAEALYDQMLRLDSTDLEILKTVAAFYKDYHRYDKAKRAYERVIGHPEVKEWEVAESYCHWGELQKATKNLPTALEAFEKSEKICTKLCEIDSTSVIFQNGLAISYQYIGNVYSDMGNLRTALTFYGKFNRLKGKLCSDSPNDIFLKKGYAISYEKLGSTNLFLGNLEEAFSCFENGNQIAKEIHAADPKNTEFKSILALSYEKLGRTHIKLGNLEKSLTFFEEEIQLFKELTNANPANASFKYGLAISYAALGTTHNSLGNFSEALAIFEKVTEIFNDLYILKTSSLNLACLPPINLLAPPWFHWVN